MANYAAIKKWLPNKDSIRAPRKAETKDEANSIATNSLVKTSDLKR